MVAEGLDWNDNWIQSLDLEYHNLNPDKGLYFDLRKQGVTKRLLDDDLVKQSIITPPQDTRSRARSGVMRALTGQKARYVIDWDSIYVEDEKYLNMEDPFLTYDIEAEEFIRECRGPTPEV
jgi:proteasome accessory factor A